MSCIIFKTSPHMIKVSALFLCRTQCWNLEADFTIAWASSTPWKPVSLSICNTTPTSSASNFARTLALIASYTDLLEMLFFVLSTFGINIGFQKTVFHCHLPHAVLNVNLQDLVKGATDWCTRRSLCRVFLPFHQLVYTKINRGGIQQFLYK